MLDHVILSKFKDSLITQDLQFGFKKRHSTSQCTFVLNEIVQYYENQGTGVKLALLDASKAFDRVEYTKLFKLLLKRNMSPYIIRILINMYTSQSIRVRWGMFLTELSTVSNGVKQGGVLSPIMFIVYVDELLSRLNNSPFGCYVGNVFCGALGYADDDRGPYILCSGQFIGHMPRVCI